MTTTLPFGFYDLIDQFARPGCAVCHLLLADVERLLDSILYEFATEPDMQTDFRDSRGLCAEHGWRMVQIGAARGGALNIAKLYERPLADALALLGQVTPDAGAQAGLMRRLFAQHPNAALIAALEPEHPCIACKLLNASEAQIIAILGDHVGDARLRAAFAASEGVCLPHFRLTLRHTQDTERARLLIETQSAIWSRLQAELTEFIRKSNYQYADEGLTGAESTSWQRVVARLGGERGVFGPQRTTA